MIASTNIKYSTTTPEAEAKAADSNETEAETKLKIELSNLNKEIEGLNQKSNDILVCCFYYF